MENVQPRGKLSIWLIGLILGPFFLMLWLGRGRLAFLYLLVQFVFFGLLFTVVGAGMIAPPAMVDFGIMAFLLSLPFYVVGLIHGLKIREISPRRPWFSRWYAVIILPLAAIWLSPFAIREFFYQPFNMPSGSMIPSLMVGDYFFVSKAAYGYSRFSFPLGLANFSGRIWSAEPQRGDIVVFKLPRDNETDYVKRLIGLPGDRIQMRDGVLHIDGVAVPKQRVADFVHEMGEGLGGPSRNMSRPCPTACPTECSIQRRIAPSTIRMSTSFQTGIIS